MSDQNTNHSCCAPLEDSSDNSISDIHEIVSTPTVVKSGVCPMCNTKGKKVDGATVKSMLSVSLRDLQDIQYFFCREADCNTVYFSEDGSQIFGTQEVRERVYQKEPDAGDVFACYCFRHTPDSIRTEMLETGTSTVVDEINTGIKAGQCACDLRNPQGACCLGNVAQVVKRIKSEITPVKA
jgi:Zinc binding domain